LRGGDAADNAVRARESPEQQAALSMHRTRDLLVKQRTRLINMIRGLLAEFGVDIAQGLERALPVTQLIVDGKVPDVPIEAAIRGLPP
jgi:transposase